jgi:serine/threonine protein kinase
MAEEEEGSLTIDPATGQHVLKGECVLCGADGSRHTFDSVVGRGTFASVLAAKGATYVVKVPKERRRSSMIQHEHNILQKLDHPNIICALGVLDTKFGTCLVLPRMGDTLLCCIVRGMTVKEQRRASTELMQAVMYLETKHVTHMDVHTANVMMKRDKKELTLIDFGAALDWSANPSATSRSHLPMYAVSRYYRSPAGLMETPFIPAALMPWSVGVIIMEMAKPADGTSSPFLMGGTNAVAALQKIESVISLHHAYMPEYMLQASPLFKNGRPAVLVPRPFPPPYWEEEHILVLDHLLCWDDEDRPTITKFWPLWEAVIRRRPVLNAP